MMIALFTIAVLSPIVGTHADFSNNKLRNWRAMCIVGGLCNFGMMAMFLGGIWIIGMIFGGLTAIFTEIQLPIRSVYMEYVAKDDATRSYLGAMRQCSSYSAQTVYALVISGIQLFLSDPSIWSMIAAGLCAAWFITMMFFILRRFTEHGASRTNEAGTNIVVLTFTEIIKEFYNWRRLPEAFKFLIAHVPASQGPVVVTLVSTYLPGQLERSGIQVSIVALIVLLLGIGATSMPRVAPQEGPALLQDLLVYCADTLHPHRNAGATHCQQGRFHLVPNGPPLRASLARCPSRGSTRSAGRRSSR